MEELGKAAVMTEDILADRKLCVSDPGDRKSACTDPGDAASDRRAERDNGATVWKMCKVARLVDEKGSVRL